MNRKKNIILIGIFASILLVSVIAILGDFTGDSEYAIIKKDGKVLQKVLLSVDNDFVISDKLGENEIEIRNSRVRVVSANCPDGICVSRGWAKPGDLPIVCLPHKLVITFPDTEPTEADMISR